MNTEGTKPKRVQVPMHLTPDEKSWLRSIADHYGISMADVARMLLHAEAERRGLKEKAAA